MGEWSGRRGGGAGQLCATGAPAGLDRLVVKVSTMSISRTAAKPATLVMFDSIDSDALKALQNEERGDLDWLAGLGDFSL